MSTKNQSKLSFNGVEITNVHFDSQEYYDGKSSIKFDILPKIFYETKDHNSYKIIMVVDIIAEKFFNLRLNALGSFKINDEELELSEEQKKFFINLNSPAIMFPYVRSFVATFTGNLGNVIPRLNLPTQFFDTDLDEIDINEVSKE